MKDDDSDEREEASQRLEPASEKGHRSHFDPNIINEINKKKPTLLLTSPSSSLTAGDNMPSCATHSSRRPTTSTNAARQSSRTSRRTRTRAANHPSQHISTPFLTPPSTDLSPPSTVQPDLVASDPRRTAGAKPRKAAPTKLRVHNPTNEATDKIVGGGGGAHKSQQPAGGAVRDDRHT